jgi:phenylacetate-CoA ligase
MLQRWRPRYLTGYASALEVFAKFLSHRPEVVIRPCAIKSTAEVLSARQRSLIQSVFGCPVYDFYGSREVNNIAAECREQRGLHVNSLARYVEVVDQERSPVPSGVPGRLLVTDLTNYSMPLIRYENEDVATWSEGSCPCGRSLPRLSALLGRKSDFIVLPRGKLIHGEFFTHLFYGVSDVLQFQVLQSAADLLRVDVVLESGADPSILCPIIANIQEVLGDAIECKVRVVDQITKSMSGKHRFTISQVEVPWGMAAVEAHVPANQSGSPE